MWLTSFALSECVGGTRTEDAVIDQSISSFPSHYCEPMKIEYGVVHSLGSAAIIQNIRPRENMSQDSV